MCHMTYSPYRNLRLMVSKSLFWREGVVNDFGRRGKKKSLKTPDVGIEIQV